MAGLLCTGKGKITFYIEEEENPKPSISFDGDATRVNNMNNMHGELENPVNRNSRDIFFLPQRPYMVLGTLRQQLLYPTWAEDATANSDGAKATGA